MGITTEAIVTNGLDPLLSIDDLAGYLGVPVATIYDRRVSGKGPCAIKVGRHLKFAVDDAGDWVERHRESSPGHAHAGR